MTEQVRFKYVHTYRWDSVTSSVCGLQNILDYMETQLCTSELSNRTFWNPG